LPEIRVSAFSQKVADTDLLFELESSYNNFVRGLGSAGQRLDLRPRLSYPYSPVGLFTVTPRIGARETVYDTKVVGLRSERGFIVESTTDEFTHRSLFETGLDLEARAFRVFDLGGALGIQRLQHAIEPRLSYNFISEANQDDLPQFDGTDLIRSTNGVTYSLTNRLKARSEPSETYPQGRVWEVLRLTVSQTYDLEDPPQVQPTSPINLPGTAPPVSIPPVRGRRLSDVSGDLIFEPVFGLRFRGTAAFDPYAMDVRTATTDVTYQAKDVYVSFGTRHGEGGVLEFIQGEVGGRLSPRFYARFSSQYDLLSATVVENRFELSFREQCWAITAAFIDRTNEDEFRISINLLELGQYGFGRAFTSQ
jgi:LPS-assembly protein